MFVYVVLCHMHVQAPPMCIHESLQTTVSCIVFFGGGWDYSLFAFLMFVFLLWYVGRIFFFDGEELCCVDERCP